MLVKGAPGVEWFLKENLPALNFFELHATKRFVSLGASIIDNTRSERSSLGNLPAVNILKIWVWRPTSVILRHLISSIISYLGMICKRVIVRPRSHMLIVRRKLVPTTAMKYFTFSLGDLLHSDIYWYISKYLETTWHFIPDSYIY